MVPYLASDRYQRQYPKVVFLGHFYIAYIRWTLAFTLQAAFADDIGIPPKHEDSPEASKYIQHHLSLLQKWVLNWTSKYWKHVTLTANRKTCPPVNYNNCRISQAKSITYLGLMINERRTWNLHVINTGKKLIDY